MIRAFVFLTVRSFRNRIVSRLKRLRNVRYLVSFLAGLAYFWFFAFRHMFDGRATVRNMGLPASELFVDLVAVLVLSMMVLAWALPKQSAGLTFSEAEIQFLFPAPLTRRQLLLYKILRAQPQVLISAAVMSVVIFRGAKFIGVWACFVALSIYFTFVALGRARLKLLGIGFLVRLPVIGAAAAGLWVLLWRTVDVAAFRGMGATLRPGRVPDLPALFHGPVADAVLFVPRFFSQAVLPASVAQLLASCGIVLAAALLFFELAARTNIAVEEASIQASEKWAARRARLNEQHIGKHVTFPRIPPPFRIPARARPEVAIYWKNVTAGLRISSPWLLIMAICALYFLGQSYSSSEPAVRMTLAMLSLTLAATFPFLGSTVFTQDMRLDLPRMELLKSYPISGERLVAAEIAGPLTFVAAVELMLLSTAAIILQGADLPRRVQFLASAEFVVIALLLAVPVCAAQILIRNAVPILLPGWALRAPDEQRGFIVMGQRLVMMAGNLVVLLFVLLPAACIVVPGLLVAKFWFGGSMPVVALTTVLAAGLLFFEVWLGIRFLGHQFEKIDVTNELDAVAS
ncbi:MAG TPA: putative ABC exporter domain-containing protein [Thermoanaerobaculia bacterium]|nr:putative ABC exporter domain-containing protein [Thermoanaerobaculia bacterium]